MKRTWLAAACTAALSLAMAIPAFAGQWQQNANGWWYSQDDGTYPSGGWYWIDQDLDKKAECYYFNQDGYCLMGLPAPDGGLTNASGAWIVNDVVQTQTVTAEVTKRNTFLRNLFRSLTPLPTAKAASILPYLKPGTSRWPRLIFTA